MITNITYTVGTQQTSKVLTTERVIVVEVVVDVDAKKNFPFLRRNTHMNF